MKLAVMQPSYLGHSGFFDLIRAADRFVLLDSVEYSHQSWQQRNRVRLQDGRIVWLTVPVRKPHTRRLNLVEIDGSRGWQRKHWATIQACYSRSPGWPRLQALLEPVYTLHAWKHLADLTCELIYLLAREQGIKTPIRRASLLLAGAGDDRHGRLVNLCRYFDADTYLTTPGAGYLDGLDELVPGLRIERFAYAQPPGEHLSVIDDIARAR